MKSSVAATASGMAGTTSILDLTFIVFLVLKLTNVIDWSWWWVSSPIWLPLAAAAVVLIIAGIVAASVK